MLPDPPAFEPTHCRRALKSFTRAWLLNTFALSKYHFCGGMVLFIFCFKVSRHIYLFFEIDTALENFFFQFCHGTSTFGDLLFQFSTSNFISEGWQNKYKKQFVKSYRWTTKNETFMQRNIETFGLLSAKHCVFWCNFRTVLSFFTCSGIPKRK